MRIAVDAMGGDHAPREIVRGAVDYARSTPSDEVILVGDLPRLEREIAEGGNGRPANLRLVDAPEVIEMGEHPATALRAKRAALVHSKATRMMMMFNSPGPATLDRTSNNTMRGIV